MEETLVICIGNQARGDDGVGWAVAALLEHEQTPPLHVLTATSLDVTHAQDVSRSSRLIVVDAQRRESPAVETHAVEATGAGRDTHGMTPGALVTLAETLYGGRPGETWLVSVAAPEMEHTETLSAVARSAANEAAVEVTRLATG